MTTITQTGSAAPTLNPEGSPAEVPEPEAAFSVVGFLNTSPSDGVQRAYVAIRTPQGWRTTSSTPRLSTKAASWAEIVTFAEVGTLVVLGKVTPAVVTETAGPTVSDFADLTDGSDSDLDDGPDND